MSETLAVIPREDVFQQASSYTAISYGAMLIAAAAGIWTTRLMGPANAGVWSLIQMISSYLAYSQLGILEASGREIPYWVARGDASRAKRLQDSIFSYLGATAFLISLGCAAGAGMTSDPQKSLALIFLAFYFPMLQGMNICMTILRARKCFSWLSWASFAVACANLVFAPAATLWWGLPGFLTVTWALSLANVFYWIMRMRLEPWGLFSWRWTPKELAGLAKIGLPILLGGAAFTLLTTIDSLMVAKLLGVTMLGYYSVAVTFTTYLFQIPNLMSVVTMPHFQERYAAANDPQHLRRFLIMPVTALAFFVLPLALGACYFLAPWMIQWLLPKFTAAIVPLKILLIGTFFISLTPTAGQFLITINKQMHSLFLVLGPAVINGVLTWVWVRSGFGLEGAAVAMVLSGILFFVLIFSYATWHICPISESLQMIVWILGAAAVIFAGLAAVDGLMPASESPIISAAWALAKCSVFAAIMAPLFWYADSQTACVRRSWQQVRSLWN